MSLLTTVRTYLTTQSAVEGSSGWKCYIGYTPDDVDQVVSLEPTGGFPQDTHGGENMLQTFETRIRGKQLDYATAENKWYQIYNLLNNANLTDVNLIHPWASGPINFSDSKNRPNLTMNSRTVIKAIT